MQWKWFKLLVAGLALVLISDTMVQAGPFGLFQGGRRNRGNMDSGYQAMPVQATPVAATIDGTAPAATVATTQQQPTVIYQSSGDNGYRRGGLLGRRRGSSSGSMVIAQPVSTTTVASAQPAEQMPAPQGSTVSQQQQIIYQPVSYSRGLFGRRTQTEWVPVVVNQPVAGAQPIQPVEAPATVAQTTATYQPIYQPTTTTSRGLFGRRGRTVSNNVPIQSIPVTTASTIGTGRQAFYGPAGQQSYLDVRLPAVAANAEVLVNDAPTRQTGASRLFITPGLDSQKENIYVVKAKWMENGQPVEQTREIKVPPGRTIVVDFTQQR
jgi:uncharacterized protein (TIGR03000 family)